MNLKVSFLISVIAILNLSCKNEPDKNNSYLNEQGVFTFLGESGAIEDKAELPDNIDPEAVLCFGKGLKVGRCISKQMEKGICVGLLKHHKRVIAIEIPCEAITVDTLQQEMLSE